MALTSNDSIFIQTNESFDWYCFLFIRLIFDSSKPKFKRFSTEFDDAVFVMVDAEKYPESRKLATVDNLPTFATFKDGKLVNQIQTNKADVLKLFIDETTNN